MCAYSPSKDNKDLPQIFLFQQGLTQDNINSFISNQNSEVQSQKNIVNTSEQKDLEKLKASWNVKLNQSKSSSSYDLNKENLDPAFTGKITADLNDDQENRPLTQKVELNLKQSQDEKKVLQKKVVNEQVDLMKSEDQPLEENKQGNNDEIKSEDIAIEKEKGKKILNNFDHSAEAISENFKFSDVIQKSVKFKGVHIVFDERAEASEEKRKARAIKARQEAVQLKRLRSEKSKQVSLSLEGYKAIQWVGEGAHGSVIRVRNKKGQVKAIKIFLKDKEQKSVGEVSAKDREQEFVRETSAIAMLKYHNNGGEIGLFETIEGDNFYGLVISAGVGTLADFKDFLWDKDIRLTEDQLLSIFETLFCCYKPVLNIGFCHRDIKPSNIILHYDDLSLELIDYSVAVCVEPDQQIPGYAGTKGYIAPNIYKKKRSHNKTELISGDLFSIGITLLELAVPEFTPVQGDIEAIINALTQLQNKSKLNELLEILLFSEGDKLKKLDKYLYNVNDFQIGRVGFISRLIEFNDDFMRYLSDRYPTQASNFQGGDISDNSVLDIVASYEDPDWTDLKFLSHYHFQSGIIERRNWDFPMNKDIEFFEQMELAALFYRELNEPSNVLLCYENAIKYFIYKNDFKACDGHIKTILDLLKDEGVECDVRIFSTLAACFAEKGEMQKALFMIKTGLERQSNDILTRILLLNNYGCLLLALEGDDQTIQKSYESLKEASDLVKDIFSDAFEYTLKQWLERDFMKSSNGLHMIEFQQEERMFEIALSVKDFVPNFNSFDMREKSTLFVVVFLNYCIAKATYLIRLLEKEKQMTATIEEIYKLAHSFRQKKDSDVKLSMKFEVFSNLIKFKKIFMNATEFNSSELIKLKHEAELLETKKLDLYTYFREESIRSVFEEIDQYELFSAMIGFTLKLSTTKSNLSQVHSSKSDLDQTLSLKDLKDSILDKIDAMSEVTGLVEFFVRPTLKSNDLASIVLDLESDPDGEVSPEIQLDRLIIPENLQDVLEYGYKVSLNRTDGLLKQFWTINSIHLDLGWAASDVDDVIDICMGMNKLQWLESLHVDLGGDDITDEVYSLLAENMAGLPLLRLDLYFAPFTHLTDSQLEHITGALDSLRGLIYLRMQFTESYITSKGIKFLEESLKSLNMLEELSLIFEYCPNLTGRSILSLASILKKLPSLRILTFDFQSCGKVTLRAMKELQDCFKEKVSLRLNISNVLL